VLKREIKQGLKAMNEGFRLLIAAAASALIPGCCCCCGDNGIGLLLAMAHLAFVFLFFLNRILSVLWM